MVLVNHEWLTDFLTSKLSWNTVITIVLKAMLRSGPESLQSLQHIADYMNSKITLSWFENPMAHLWNPHQNSLLTTSLLPSLGTGRVTRSNSIFHNYQPRTKLIKIPWRCLFVSLLSVRTCEACLWTYFQSTLKKFLVKWGGRKQSNIREMRWLKIIDLPGGEINDPLLGNTFLFRSSKQFPHLFLRPLKGF